MKFTYEDKLTMYDLWKNKHFSPGIIAKQYNSDRKTIKYIVYLMDCHGVQVAKHDRNKYYSPEFKTNAIKRVLIGHESITQVSIELGLPSHGMLSLWIKSFKENGYTIVEKQRGRHPYDQK